MGKWLWAILVLSLIVGAAACESDPAEESVGGGDGNADLSNGLADPAGESSGGSGAQGPVAASGGSGPAQSTGGEAGAQADGQGGAGGGGAPQEGVDLGSDNPQGVDPAGQGDAGAAGDGAAQGDAGGATGDSSDGAGAEADACAQMDCGLGQHCELIQVQCIRAPCPPQPTCVESTACGGFAGFACPGLGTCVDDPNDDCDPKAGGADCGGYCVCKVDADCEGFDASPAVCDCGRSGGDGDGDGDANTGVKCGDTTCQDGQVCCNESCGICAEPGGVCTQQFCF